MWRSASLTSRIALLFAAATLVVFAATGVALERALAGRLEERDLTELTSNLQQVRYLLEVKSAMPELAATGRPMVEIMAGYDGLALSVYDLAGRAVVHTGAELPLRLDAAVRDPDGLPPPSASEQRVVDGVPWHLVTARGVVGLDRREPVWIVLGRDGRERALLLGEYRALLVPVLLLAALGTAALGGLAVLRAMRPLHRVAEAASRITAERLDRRIPAGDAPPEVRELIHAFNTMIGRLAASFERLSQFSADLAHEFKTPLANLLMQSQVALARPRSTAEYQALIESSIEEYERLSKTVDSMLFLARADEALVKPELQALDARAELARVAGYFEPLADEKTVRLEVVGAGAVRADPGMFRRAVSNLVDNAVRHADAGTTIRLAVREDGDAVVEVENRGAGIAAADLPHVFERFYRADRARVRSPGSTGLGLAIVRSIMALHRGSARIESEAGRTVVRLRFPGPARAAAAPRPEPRPGARPGPGSPSRQAR